MTRRSNIDPAKLKEFQKDLEERSSGTKGWINQKQVRSGLDFRIIDPLPNMNGLYFLEVPILWINGHKLVRPTLIEDHDICKTLLEEAEQQDDADIQALLKAKGPNGPKVKEEVEYWIPILQFQWKLEGDEIVGIWDKDDKPDPNLIDKYIVDQLPKILTCKVQLMNAINKLATTRGGHLMFDCAEGFNVFAGASGEGRNTTYTAQKMDALPMPEKYYNSDLTPDLQAIYKASLYTDEYMEKIICNYLYGEEPPEENDDKYRYPEVREELSKRNKSESRTSSSKGETDGRTPEESEEQIEKTKKSTGRPSRPSRSESSSPSNRSNNSDSTGSPSKSTRTDRGSGTSRPRTGGHNRNIASDIQDVQDE